MWCSVHGTHSTQKNTCALCKQPASRDDENVRTCSACWHTVHLSCAEIHPAFLPDDGFWFCEQCFPRARHFYYPPRTERHPDPIETARVVQILTGQAERLDPEAQLRFVETFLKRLPASQDGTRYFIHDKVAFERRRVLQQPVSYTHLTLPTTPYV